MIHPALENLALTPSGSLFARYFELRLDLVLKSLAYLADLLLNERLRIWMVKQFILSNETLADEESACSGDTMAKSVAQLGTASGLAALIEMARSEFARVKELDHERLIKPHVERLRLIYAIDDHWVNAQNRQELRGAYPGLHMPFLKVYLCIPCTQASTE